MDTTNIPATAADFDRWEDKSRSMSRTELAYSITDCAKTANALAWNPVREGRYWDEYFTYAAEVARREREGL